jgi:hypothetical protein
VNVSSIISKSEPENASISFLKSIFEPSNDAVGQYGCRKVKNVDPIQTYYYRDIRKEQQPSHSKHRVDALESIFENLKQNQTSNEFQQIGYKLDQDSALMGTDTNHKSLHAEEDSRLRAQEKNNLENSSSERIESSSSRVGKTTTNNSFRDTSTHTSSSSSENQKDMKRKRRKSGRKESLDSFSSCSSSTETIDRRHRRRKGRKRERAEASRRSRKYGERHSKRKKKKRTRKE